MTTSIIISICFLLIFAYIFDISAAKTKIPSVILLLILGWGVKQATGFLNIAIPNLNPVLPVLGTVGLILIVLEGSLELEIHKSKLNLIGKSFFVSFIPLILISFALAYAFNYFDGTPYKIGLANAIPFAIISSAIAIPSVMHIKKSNREFVIYESSLSDIFGVIIFNFITLNEIINAATFGHFFLNILIMLVITFVATIGLALLLSNIKHHVKFVPIILLVVLIYTFSKAYHLPSLIFILLLGLFLGNIEKLKQFKYLDKIRPVILQREVHRFREIISELAFLVRALFFLLFGYLIETAELLNLDTIIWAGAITVGIFIVRAIHLLIAKLPLNPLLFIAPRGLITILLFLSIPVSQTIGLVNNSLIIQVIILTALVMMYGLIYSKNPDKKSETLEEEQENKRAHIDVSSSPILNAKNPDSETENPIA
jgi:potassium/hydrogen antiporter